VLQAGVLRVCINGGDKARAWNDAVDQGCAFNGRQGASSPARKSCKYIIRFLRILRELVCGFCRHKTAVVSKLRLRKGREGRREDAVVRVHGGQGRLLIIPVTSTLCEALECHKFKNKHSVKNEFTRLDSEMATNAQSC
jgi:hypothetical protein